MLGHFAVAAVLQFRSYCHDVFEQLLLEIFLCVVMILLDPSAGEHSPCILVFGALYELT